jgi:hypothetical protein
MTICAPTRTVIALCDLLMRANWARRVLFLADRVALVNQAIGAFKKFLPSASPVNLVTEKDATGRVYVSTYPTMMRLIDEAKNGKRRFGPGHFDLIVIDEAHRSVYRKYGAIFDYFDSLVVGLTATPKDEVDRDTYRLFDLQRGVPTDAYGLDEAVKDGFLVPPRAVSVPLKFPRDGIRYDQLSDEEKEQWDAVEWDETGTVPAAVEPGALNKWLFNADTVDKVLEHLMTNGIMVADTIQQTCYFDTYPSGQGRHPPPRADIVSANSSVCRSRCSLPLASTLFLKPHSSPVVPLIQFVQAPTRWPRVGINHRKEKVFRLASFRAFGSLSTPSASVQWKTPPPPPFS